MHLRKSNLSVWPYALPITLVVLALIYYWFTIADRYSIFLYYHDMGSRFPDTSPFSDVTRSRYWMTGLVAGGAVMVLYTCGNWLMGCFVQHFHPPAWWQVWLWCAVPMLIGIPIITMTANHPVLPPLDAAQTTLATLIGVGLALMPGRLAAERPEDLVWLALDGVALMFPLLFMANLEDVARWWSSGSLWLVWFTGLGITIGAIGLFIMTALRIWWRTPMPRGGALFAAGLSIAYLLLPLVHHLYVGIVEGYFYITTASNFFADSVPLQVVTWLIVAAIALGITQLRQKLAKG